MTSLYSKISGNWAWLLIKQLLIKITLVYPSIQTHELNILPVHRCLGFHCWLELGYCRSFPAQPVRTRWHCPPLLKSAEKSCLGTYQSTNPESEGKISTPCLLYAALFYFLHGGPIFGTTKTGAFSTSTQSRFEYVVLGRVLGPSWLAHHS